MKIKHVTFIIRLYNYSLEFKMNCCNQNSSELELYFDSPQSFKESQELAQLSRSD